MTRRAYAELYGPTTGDLVRLGDTSLLARVEHDHAVPGDELVGKVGGTVREGQGVASWAAHSTGALDLVITNVVVIDPILGVVKGDLGVRDGRIVGLGKAGNPDVMDGVHPDLIVGPHTAVVSGELLVATPGAVEAHAHLLDPGQVDHCVAAGTTSIVAMDWGNLLDIAVSGPTAMSTPRASRRPAGRWKPGRVR